jgi:FkbM family methyltransferase
LRPGLHDGKDNFFIARGYAPKGVVHVGANDGEEIVWYLHSGRVPILGFEPHPDVFRTAYEDFGKEIGDGRVTLAQYALAKETGSITLRVPVVVADGSEATKGSSGLPELDLDSQYAIGRYIQVPMTRFDDWVAMTGHDMSPYDLLVIDVQGMELEVLQGFGDHLQGFNFLMVELSDTPLYQGEAPAAQVGDWLAERGFSRVSPYERHNDVMFIKNTAL